MIIHCAISY